MFSFSTLSRFVPAPSKKKKVMLPTADEAEALVVLMVAFFTAKGHAAKANPIKLRVLLGTHAGKERALLEKIAAKNGGDAPVEDAATRASAWWLSQGGATKAPPCTLSHVDGHEEAAAMLAGITSPPVEVDTIALLSNDLDAANKLYHAPAAATAAAAAAAGAPAAPAACRLSAADRLDVLRRVEVEARKILAKGDATKLDQVTVIMAAIGDPTKPTTLLRLWEKLTKKEKYRGFSAGFCVANLRPAVVQAGGADDEAEESSGAEADGGQHSEVDACDMYERLLVPRETAAI